MNNIDKVFSTVKKEIEKQQKLAEINSFESVAKDAKVPLDKLPQYLSHLQDIGLIKYSMKDKYIHLTPLGKKQKKTSAA